MITLKQNSYTDACPMEEILQVSTIDSLNKAFSLMGYRFKGKPRKVQIAKGIVKHIKENPREVLERLDTTSLKQLKELLEKGKGNAIVLDGTSLFTPLQKMLLVLSYENTRENKTYLYLIKDLYDIFSPVINDIEIPKVEENTKHLDDNEGMSPDDFKNGIALFNSKTKELLDIARQYGARERAVIIITLDYISKCSLMKLPFNSYKSYEEDIETLFNCIRYKMSDKDINAITYVIMNDFEDSMSHFGKVKKKKDRSFDDVYDVLGYLFFNVSLEAILKRLHSMLPKTIQAMLEYKRSFVDDLEFENIEKMADEIFAEASDILSESNVDSLGKQLGKSEKDDMQKGNSQPKESRKHKPNIFPKDWLATRTYTTMNDVDKQYLSFANTVYDILERHFATIPSFTRKMVAIAITSYIEDKQSNLGLFPSYVAMIRRENGAEHPFVSSFGDVVPIERMRKYINDYADDKINTIDVAYLLATNSTEFADEADNHFKDAEHLLQMLEANGYKSLPSNDEYFDDLCDLVELNGWQGLKTFLLWLMDKSYFLSPMTAALALDESVVEEVQKTYGTSSKNLVQACKIHGVFNKGLYKVGVRPVTFAEDFARRAELDANVIKQLGEVEVIEPMMYGIESVSKDKLILTDMAGEKYTVSIDKDDRNNYSKNYSVGCKLVKYGDMWHSILPPRILHRKLTEEEKKDFRKAYDKDGICELRHR